MDKDGTNRIKISQGDGKYSQPCWSPRGDLVAFVKQKKGSFYLGVMGCEGESERLIHSSYLIERPCFAENGRYISFVEGERSGRSKICMIDITGNPLSYRCIRTKGSACDVSWIGKKKSA
jgi:TolB protein